MIAATAPTTGTPYEHMRQIRFKACRWRDMLWQTVLEDLADRDPAAARAARAAALPQRRVYSVSGSSTRAAALAWRYLDYEAREDWLWICTAMQQMLMRGASVGQCAVWRARDARSETIQWAPAPQQGFFVDEIAGLELPARRKVARVGLVGSE